MATPDLDRIFDQYLVTRAQGGSREAFEALARQWIPRLLRFSARTLGRSEPARDVVQETWIGVIRGLGSLDDPASFPAWIYGIAHRKCIDAIRAKQRWRKLSASVQEQARVAEQATSPSDPAGAGIDLATAMSGLHEDQRHVVHLFYGEDLSVSEIAAVLDVPAGTVKSRLFHARKFLKKHLGESHEQH